MKKILIKLSLVLTVFMMVLSLTTGNVFATNSSQDGLVVNTTTDKETYKKGEKATTTISVTNTNSYEMEDITINVTLPEELSTPETNFKIPILETNETKEYKVVVENNDSKVIIKPSDTNKSDNISEQKSPSTGDKISSDLILGLIALAGISGLAIIILKKNNRLKKLMIFALISTMVLSGISIKEVYAENSTMIEKKISLVQPIIYENKDYNMNIDVIYHISNGEVITKGEVTREEWITTLVDLFDYTYVTNITTYSFSDYQEAKDPFKIETAIQYSIIDIKENEEFKPNEYATREFVAYTTIQALNLFNTSKGSLDCIDKNTLKYPDEDYLMVKFDMLKLIDNQFKPNQYVSGDEIKQVIKIIKEIINSTKIDESNKDYIDYQDDVKVIEDTFEQASNNTILLDDDNKIQKGDLVVINGNQADGIAMKVENVQEKENQLQIQYSQPSLEDILESIHVEEIADNSNATFTPADGVVVENQLSTRSRDKHDSIPLDKELKLKTDMNDLSASISLNLNEVQYRFDVDYSLFGGLQVHDAYLALDTDVNANITYQGSENLIEREETEKYRLELLHTWDTLKKDLSKELKNIIRFDIKLYHVLVVDKKLDVIGMNIPKSKRVNTITWGNRSDSDNYTLAIINIIEHIVRKELANYKSEYKDIVDAIIELAIDNELTSRVLKKSVYLRGDNSLKYLKRQLYPYFLMYLGYSKEEILNRMMEDKIIFELDKYTYERGLATVDLKTFIDFCIKNQKHILKISELEII